MARLRGRSATIKFDIPAEVDDEDVVGYIADAFDEMAANISPRNPLSKGLKLREVKFNGEKWEV